jgi:hypothetical protein
VRNWDGGVSPVVHQLDHFLGELEDIYDSGAKLTPLALFGKKSTGNVNTARLVDQSKAKEVEADGKDDRGWQALAASRCLWGCADSPTFT